MIFIETSVPGAFIIDIEPIEDERGWFARTFCHREFEARGLNPGVAQCSLSFNRRRGTVRGMHFQSPPFQEAKLVRSTAGAILDVVLDLRPNSPAFLHHFGVELSAANRRMIYVPEGCAHGFQTLEDGSEILYQISNYYAPEAACGVCWHDPAFNIHWPLDIEVISIRDMQYTAFRGATDPRIHAAAREMQ